MTQPPEKLNLRNRQIMWLIVGAVAVVVIVCLVVFIISQMASLENLAQYLPSSSNATQVAVNNAALSETPTPAPSSSTQTSIPPTPTVPPTPTSPPTFTPTPTFTSTPTRTPTPTATPDPWITLGDWTAGCNTEVTFNPVNARQFKFTAISGGGDDKMISFYCCTSHGAAWLVNGDWLPVTNPSLTLRVGETRETIDFGSATVDRQRFNVGCNDGEQMNVRVDYLPATISITTTAILTTTATMTATTTLTTTETPTATLTVTATETTTTTVTPTSTLTITTPITTATTPTPPPAPHGGIAYHKNDTGIDRSFVVNLDTNTTTPLVDIGPVMDLAMSTNASFGAWSPDNSKFAFISTGSPGASNILQVMDFQAGKTRPLYSSDTGGGLSSPTWSPDGTKIAFIRVSGNQHVWAVDVVNADGTRCSDKYECELTTNTQGEQYRGGLSWSTLNYFALAINSTGPNNVFSMFSDGNGRANITNDASDDSTPAWSPDGKQIAFTSTRGGRPQIYVMDADGKNLRRVSQGDTSDFSPTWSPDGNWIAFASFRGGSTDIYMMDLNGANVTRLTKTGGDHPTWSR